MTLKSYQGRSNNNTLVCTLILSEEDSNLANFGFTEVFKSIIRGFREMY